MFLKVKLTFPRVKFALLLLKKNKLVKKVFLFIFVLKIIIFFLDFKNSYQS